MSKGMVKWQRLFERMVNMCAGWHYGRAYNNKAVEASLGMAARITDLR